MHSGSSHLIVTYLAPLTPHHGHGRRRRSSQACALCRDRAASRGERRRGRLAIGSTRPPTRAQRAPAGAGSRASAAHRGCQRRAGAPAVKGWPELRSGARRPSAAREDWPRPATKRHEGQAAKPRTLNGGGARALAPGPAPGGSARAARSAWGERSEPPHAGGGASAASSSNPLTKTPSFTLPIRRDASRTPRWPSSPGPP